MYHIWIYPPLASLLAFTLKKNPKSEEKKAGEKNGKIWNAINLGVLQYFMVVSKFLNSWDISNLKFLKPP
jgi:hypothetical protein